jgi:hypothetical protein
MNFYFFKTTAVNQFDASAKTVPALGRKDVIRLIGEAQDGEFTPANWNDLKAIERTILSVGKEAEMSFLVSESSFYGKKYIAVTF